MILHIR